MRPSCLSRLCVEISNPTSDYSFSAATLLVFRSVLRSTDPDGHTQGTPSNVLGCKPHWTTQASLEGGLLLQSTRVCFFARPSVDSSLRPCDLLVPAAVRGPMVVAIPSVLTGHHHHHHHQPRSDPSSCASGRHTVCILGGQAFFPGWSHWLRRGRLAGQSMRERCARPSRNEPNSTCLVGSFVQCKASHAHRLSRR